VSAFFRGYFDYELRNGDDIPRRGAFILAPNHLSLVDPVFTSLAAHENVRYLAVDELFGRSRFFDSLTGFWGAIPLPRGGVPWAALQAAIRTIRADRPVSVYPEARRVDFWGEASPATGAAWLALLTGAPLFPLALEGTEHVMSHRAPKFRRASVRVTVCDPVDPLDYMDHEDPLAAATAAWQQRMIEVLGPPRTSR
jgi:1-acyl-sn-glycerol-3-phosphate acyltransferase